MPTTTDVAPTPGPSSGEEALLAVQYSAYTELPGGTTLLRREDGRWQQITLPGSTKDVYLVGTAFSSPSVAWAFGSLGTSEEDPQVCLYRSDDAGQTWVDVSSLVDVGVNRSARSMIFSSPEDGFLVAPRAFTLPTQEPLADSTLMTRDGGRSFAPAGGCLELRLCAGQAECLVPRGSVGAAPGAERYCEPVPNSDPLVNDNYIYAFDTRLDGRGIVCGDREQRPYCQYTTDGGTTWHESAMADDLNEDYGIVGSVVLADDGGAWATADTGAGATFLRSDDGGRSWRRFGATLRHSRFFGLSRSSAVADRGFAIDR